MRALLAVLAFLAFLASPAAAHAGPVFVAADCERVDGTCTTTVYYRAGAGEANDVEAEHVAGAVDITDRGARMTPGSGCSDRGENRVRCGAGVIVLVLGDGADAATLRGVPLERDTVEGGDGDDRLTGFPRAAGDGGADAVAGTRGNDLLHGGPGPDRLAGGDGDDLLGGDVFSLGSFLDGAIAADVLDGGAGSDIAAYRRPTAVKVDLTDPGFDGGPGEGDQLTGIEGVSGGFAADVLIGDGGRNRLAGGGGDDRVDCRGGDDEAEGGGALLTGCERVDLGSTGASVEGIAAVARGGRLTFRLPCRRSLRPRRPRGRCRVVFTASQPGGRRIVVRRRLRPGGGRVTVPAGDPSAPLRLTVRYRGRFALPAVAAWALAEGGHSG